MMKKACRLQQQDQVPEFEHAPGAQDTEVFKHSLVKGPTLLAQEQKALMHSKQRRPNQILCSASKQKC